ncbi:BolA-like protein, partial [Coemansia erecta]
VSMASKDIIEQRIKENIGDIHLIRAEDVSGGCGSMFNLLIVSDKFKGLSRISQHRLVHQALGEIKDQLHALSLYSKLHPIADVEASEEETKAQVDANANAAAAQPKEDEEKEDKNDISG